MRKRIIIVILMLCSFASIFGQTKAWSELNTGDEVYTITGYIRDVLITGSNGVYEIRFKPEELEVWRNDVEIDKNAEISELTVTGHQIIIHPDDKAKKEMLASAMLAHTTGKKVNIRLRPDCLYWSKNVVEWIRLYDY